MAKKRKTELDVDLDIPVDEEPEPVVAPEAAPQETEEPSGEEKKSKFKLPSFTPKILIIIIASIVLLLAIGGAVYFLTREPAPPEPEQQQEEEKKEDKEEDKEDEEEVTFPIIPQYKFEPFFLPVKNEKNEDVFLKTAISVDLSSDAVIKEIELNVSLIRANISFLIKKKTLSDLKADSERTKLSDEMIEILNRSLQRGTVKKIYFTQFFFK